MNFTSIAKHLKSTLAERIRLARRWAGLSQAAIAKRFGVTASAVAQWEHPNGTQPNVKRLEVLARATGVSVGWLVTGEGEPRKTPPGGVEEPPAVLFDVYAETLQEEVLLKTFRLMPAKAREHFVALAYESTQHRRRSRIKPR